MRAYGRNFEETILAWEPDVRFAFRVDRGAGSSTLAFVEDWRLEGIGGNATRATWTMGVDTTLPSAVMRLQMTVQQAVLMQLGKGRIERVAKRRLEDRLGQ